MPRQKYAVPKLVTSKEPILHEYPDVSEGTGSFPGLHLIIYRLIQVLPPSKLHAIQFLSTLKKYLNKK